MFDGDVSQLVRDPVSGDVFAGGGFTREQALVGDLFTAGASGAPRALPVGGPVNALASDGHGGWYAAWRRATPFGSQFGFAHLSSAGVADPGWSPAPDGPVAAVVAAGDTVYVAGGFTHIGGAARPGLAALDAAGRATAWDPGADVSGIAALALSGTTLYAGGDFTQIAGAARHDLAAFDTTTGALTAWDPDVVGDFGVVALAVAGTTVYAGGSFGSAGGTPRRNLAAFDAVSGAVSPWDPEPDDFVFGLAADGSAVYAAGWPARARGPCA